MVHNHGRLSDSSGTTGGKVRKGKRVKILKADMMCNSDYCPLLIVPNPNKAHPGHKTGDNPLYTGIEWLDTRNRNIGYILPKDPVHSWIKTKLTSWNDVYKTHAITTLNPW